MLVVFTITIFLGAALLFFVQPMVAKMVLPHLGGSPAVWNTCMVFFQAALLAGYAYAHWSVRYLGPRRQSMMHMLLVLTPLLVLPIALRGGDPPTEGSPIPWLLWALAATIGLPFAVAATGGPLLQRWFAATGHRSASDPYFLYAASNAGSLLALLSYPLIVEPLTSISQQQWLWSGGYLAFAMLTIACGAIVIRAGARLPVAPAKADVPPVESIPPAADPPAHIWKQRLMWIGLAFIPSSLMLGITQYISTDIAAVPLLWVVPLSIYLLTFILAFSGRSLLSVELLSRILPILVIGLAVAFLVGATEPLTLLIILHLLTFFVAAMLCHLRLAESRPPAVRLTEFYLLIAIGGVLGGIFNAILAPVIFSAIAEYPIALALACLARRPSGLEWNPGNPWLRRAADFGAPILIGLAALFGDVIAAPFDAVLAPIMGNLDFGLIIGIGIPAFACYLLSARRVGHALGVGALLAAGLLIATTAGDVIYNERTFYGVHRIKQNSNFTELVHSNTTHGIQSRDPRTQGEPLGYYSRPSPIGQVFQRFNDTERFDRIGLVGLGTGALAAYGRDGQHMVFYEIDPAMERIARDTRWFTYLHDSRARVDVRLGDGRQSLRLHTEDGAYGLLVLDAFSSDAIPVHLLTREAVELYMHKLQPGGILAFHISNRYLNLWPVLERIAHELGLSAIHQYHHIDLEVTEETGKFTSHWVLIARDPADFGPLTSEVRWHGQSPAPSGPLWTDDFSNIISTFLSR